MSIAENLARVHARMAAAALSVGRAPQTVRLVAVSKTQPPSAIRAAYATGQRDFGENYVQEMLAKQDALRDLADICWHFIGHVQSRKTRDLARPSLWIHGLDSRSAIEKLDARCREAGLRLPVLLQINVGVEATKSGVTPEGAIELGRLLLRTQTLDWRGLMTIPPPLSGEPLRALFRHMRELRDRLSDALAHPLPELSMGMSADFELAIAEGATIIRVGTAIFGEREKTT